MPTLPDAAPRAGGALTLPLDLSAPPQAENAVRVRRRFLRSVHLERDFYTPGATEGYVPTPAARGALARILPGAADKPAARAFSVTGPYGSGKSAFALTLAKALAVHPVGDADLRGAAEAVLEQPLFGGDTQAGLWPVLIVGGREPLTDALVNGLARSWERLPIKSVALPPLPVARTGAEVARFYEEASARLRAAGAGVRGILLILDETGKFLEHAAARPDENDVQALQELAEAAVRSPVDAPLLVVTILHQSFDEYAQRLGATTRNEWRKVQGRFTDLAFADAPEEMLRLVARAMERTPNAARDAVIARDAQKAAQRAHVLRLLPRAVTETEFAHLCDRAFPLHPLTLLALPHVFRRFGQGERSLFGFLSGDEPGGLNDFLAGGDNETYYRLDRLYDYLLRSVGASALIGGGAGAQSATARLWSETQEAVERSGEQEALPPVAGDVAKIIGLLHVLGDSAATHLPASADVLQFALDAVPPTQIDAALAGLTRATLITYRRYKNAFRPYEGSDLDVEERLRDVLGRRSGTHADVSALAVKLGDLAAASSGGEESDAPPLLLPLVARRHLFETGTLRVFDVVLRRADELPQAVAGAPFVPPDRAGDAAFDGTVLLVLAPDAASADEAGARWGALYADRPDFIVGVVRETVPLQEAARTLDALLTLQAETPELARDRVAAREVRERLSEAEAAFRAEWDRLLAGGGAANAPIEEANAALSDGATVWRWKGEIVRARTARERQQLVSQACQETYPHTPRLLNELVNRRALASGAASARRLLFEAMIERGDEELLGMEGFPPERSMYAALLRETGIHRFDDERNVWAFGPPLANRDPALGRLWEAIESFLFDAGESDDNTGDTEQAVPLAPANSAAKPIARIWETLRQAPFGLSDGVIPVLLCAAFLHHASETVLYEDGAFVIGLDAATFERLAKRPELFSAQGVRIRGERARVIARLAENLLKPGEAQTAGNVVRGLYRRVARLPAFALRTSHISPDAARVRALLKDAREPERLLFAELPRAVGAAPLGDEIQSDDANTVRFFGGLNDALQSWFGAYPALLARLETETFGAFGVRDARGLRVRARAVQGGIREPRLQAFVARALETEEEAGGANKWIESVASVVMGRAPAGWTDSDAARYSDSLSPLVTALQSAELVAFARAKADGTEGAVGVRFAIAGEDGEEEARIIFTPQDAEEEIEELAARMSQFLLEIADGKSEDMRLAILGRSGRTLMRRSRNQHAQ